MKLRRLFELDPRTIRSVEGEEEEEEEEEVCVDDGGLKISRGTPEVTLFLLSNLEHGESSWSVGEDGAAIR